MGMWTGSSDVPPEVREQMGALMCLYAQLSAAMMCVTHHLSPDCHGVKLCKQFSAAVTDHIALLIKLWLMRVREDDKICHTTTGDTGLAQEQKIDILKTGIG